MTHGNEYTWQPRYCLRLKRHVSKISENKLQDDNRNILKRDLEQKLGKGKDNKEKDAF